jgi:hypothetical protein
LNFLLLKQEGNFNVEWLQNIMAFALDFNSNNKLIGGDVMNRAEACGAITPEQFGSRRDRSVD